MRESKFRAWDTKNKRWSNSYLAIDQDGKVLEFGMLNETDITKDYEIVWYTGLKDKSGTEIYGGDILLAQRWECAINLTVIWDKDIAGFCLKYPEDEDDWASNLFDDEDLSKIEVIGNIYEDKNENPNLMKNEEEEEKGT